MPDTNAPALDSDEILAGIRAWVEIESPTTNAASVNRMADKVIADYAAIGAKVQRIPGRDGFGDHVLVTSPWGSDEEPGILVLSHIDTVHDLGIIDEKLPFRVQGDIAYGPGIYDMKGGAYLPLAAMRHLVRSGRTTNRPIRHLFVSEEEVGSPTSREHIEREARRAVAVLVTEPAREGGRIVTARKGVARFDITVRGQLAHSGARHQDGRSAIKELARQILDIEAMTDYATGLTLNVGVISGGSRANVVADEARAEIDMRVPNPAIAEQAIARFLALKPYDPGCALEISGGLNRPGYEKSPEIAALFNHAKSIAADIGFELKDIATGGGSDGNFTAAIAPTLDGLGVDGKGGHTHYEQLYVSSLIPRTRLMLGLFETL
ncbi:MAG: M20 family metallopeptidase [Alphaproteobacteria bacterium]|nr:M20 family metallopeptidase [Alphaproteobacteria bacterium]